MQLFVTIFNLFTFLNWKSITLLQVPAIKSFLTSTFKPMNYKVYAANRRLQFWIAFSSSYVIHFSLTINSLFRKKNSLFELLVRMFLIIALNSSQNLISSSCPKSCLIHTRAGFWLILTYRMFKWIKNKINIFLSLHTCEMGIFQTRQAKRKTSSVLKLSKIPTDLDIKTRIHKSCGARLAPISAKALIRKPRSLASVVLRVWTCKIVYDSPLLIQLVFSFKSQSIVLLEVFHIFTWLFDLLK